MKSFSRYLIPSLISSILISTYVIIDGIFVGQKIGDLGLSAINIIWPVTALLQGIGLALGLAGGILISTLKGEEKHELADKVKLTTLVLIMIFACVLGLLFYITKEPLITFLGASNESYSYALEYLKVILAGSLFQMLGIGLVPLLKNSGKVKIAAMASISSIVVNFILDYVFLFPLDMDLDGAALASVIAQVVSALICIFAYFKELKGISFNKVIIKPLLVGSIAPFILNYSYSIIIIITNIITMKYGGDEAVAAYTLLSYILYIINASAQAVGDSIQPLFSYNEAKKERKINHNMLKKCFIISFILCLVLDLIIYIFRNQLGYLYNLSDVAFDYYLDGLIYYIFGFIFVSIIKVIASYLYAVNDTKLANIVIISEPFIITPILIIVLSILFKLNGVWISYLTVQISLFILSGFILFYRFKKECKE